MDTMRIAARVVALALGGFMGSSVFGAEYTAVMVNDIKWQEAPTLAPGAKLAVIDGDPSASGPFVMRIKLPPKSTVQLHTHPTTENVTILLGTLYFAASDTYDPKIAQAFGPGSYFSIAAGKPMFAYSTDGEVEFQIHGTGPWGITYVESKHPAKH